MNKGRYTIVTMNSNNDKDYSVIKTKVKNEQGEAYKEKVNLATIDSYLLKYFNSEKQLLHYLKSIGLAKESHDQVKITYQNLGTKTITPAFNNHILKEIAKTGDTKIDIDKYRKEFYAVYDQLLYMLEDENFTKALLKSEHLNDHLKKRFNQYRQIILENNEDNKELNEIKFSIQRSLSNYKEFRTILMILEGIELKKEELGINFKKEKQTEGQIQLTDIIDEKEEFLSDEERARAYGDGEPLNEKVKIIRMED